MTGTFHVVSCYMSNDQFARLQNYANTQRESRSRLIRDALDHHFEAIRMESLEELEKENKEMARKISENKEKIEQLKDAAQDPTDDNTTLDEFGGNGKAKPKKLQETNT